MLSCPHACEVYVICRKIGEVVEIAISLTIAESKRSD